MWKVRDPENGLTMNLRNSKDDTDIIIPVLQQILDDDIGNRGVWLILPGFGEPQLPKKIAWLWANVEKIRNTLPPSWFLFVFIAQYSEKASFFLDPLSAYPVLPRVLWCIRQHTPSFLGTFLREQMKPSLLHPNIAAVLVLLDDVELEDSLCVRSLLQWMEVEDLHTISPILSRKSTSCHWFMHSQFKTPLQAFRRTNFVEMFFQLFTVHGYQKWWTMLQPFTKYLWGVDMAMHHQGFRIGILETMSVIHHISSKDKNNPTYTKMQQECTKFTNVFKQHIAFQFENLWISIVSSSKPPLIRRRHLVFSKPSPAMNINPRYPIQQAP